MELALENLGISDVLSPSPEKERPPTWVKDNTKACTLISWAVDNVNIQYIKPHKRDAAGMWAPLKRAHKDSSSGGRLHLLQQLITMSMETEDVDTHLQAMSKVFDKLDSLVDDSNPLTTDDIFTSSLINSLPGDWLHVVTPLMQRPTLDSSTVIRAVQAESTRRKTVALTSNVETLSAKASLARRSEKPSVISRNNQSHHSSTSNTSCG